MLRSLVRFFLLVVTMPTSILTAPSIAVPQKKEYFNYFSIQSVSADHARDRGSHFVAISKSFLPNKNMGSGYKDNEAFSPTNEKVRTETGPRRIDTLPLATQFEGVKSLVTSQPRTTPVVDSRSRDGLSSRLTCDVCKTFIGLLQRLVAEQRTTEDIVKIAIVFCKTFKIEDDRVCELVVPEFQEMVLAVVRGTLFSPDEICGIVLGNTCATPYDPMAMWNITISNKLKPPVKPHTPPKPGSPVVRVLHVTDIHLDAEYTPDADAECGEPLCCRAFDTNPAPTPSRRAGQWGDYRDCDSPWSTVENLFRHFSDIRDEFDYVIFTGDIPAHDVWNQTRTAQLTSLRRIADLFRKYLPDKPVYTCMGNHESVPVNSYPPDSAADQSMEWLYSANMQAWGYWLPMSTYSTIFKGAFYEFSPYPGFRIISINSNYGTNRNWWLLLNATDPQGQLQWLADVLQDAEDKGDKVHLLYHHPPGDVLNAFSVNFYRLVNRYESTIAGQFNGHTHTDEYRVFYDMQNKSRPVGVAYIGGSVTPGGKLNPAYRIYTVDGNYTGSSWEVLDYKQYYFDLTQANQGGSLSWRYEYTPKVAYSMDNLYPEDWSKLIYRMKANDTLFQIYNGFYYKSAPNHPPCLGACKKDLLCSLKSARTDDPELCQDL